MREFFKIGRAVLAYHLFAICFFGAGTSTALALEIWVKDRAVVEGDTVYLGDIAKFDPAGDERVAHLVRVEVSSAPPPGKNLILNNHLLIYKIGSAVAGMKDIEVKIPESLSVYRKAQSISSEKLKEIFREHVLENISWPAKDVRFENISVPGAVMLPMGQMVWEVKNRGGEDYSGDVSVVVSFLGDGKLVRKIPLAGRISVKQTVIRAARKIRAGELIEAGDVVSAAEPSLEIRKDGFNGTEEVIGKRAVHALQAGQRITSKMVECPPVVQKGDRVIIKAENKLIKITALGKVLEDGRAGDQVKVMNISSGKEIWATVIGPGKVSVTF